MSESIADPLGKEEELDPELVAYVDEDGPLGMCIKHPLVYSICHHPMLNARYNAVLKAKQKALAKAEEEGKWSTYLWLHERPYRLFAFGEIQEELDEETYWQLLGEIWVDSENIWQNEEEWKTYLDPADRNLREQFIMDEDDQAMLDMLPDKIKVYRGFTVEGRENGLSWTTDSIRAKWFARRFVVEDDERARVAIGWVAKADVIAHFNRRNESEIVVLPEDVKDMKVKEISKEAL